jgi:phosphatidylserine decarboxylase
MAMHLKLKIMALLPKNTLSEWVGWAVRRRWPFGLHTWLRNTLIRTYKIKVDEAEKPLHAYPTFGDFFVRKLRPGMRPVAEVSLVSPVDGLLTSRGLITATGTLTQAKGSDYALDDFLSGDIESEAKAKAAERFAGGVFFTIYLAPYNYHRIHSPCSMLVERMAHVPGALWPVNSWSVAGLPGLFVRNDRVMVHGQVEGMGGGDVALAMVGATNVGRITLDAIPGFHANIGADKKPYDIRLPHGPFDVARAEGLGCFEMGSTVIVLLGKSWVPRLLPWVMAGEPRIVRMGEALSHS